MRVVGGEFGGRRLTAPGSNAIRPSSDRLRQTLFDVLAHGYGDPARDARVLDLFAGTGALAIEAISRGARFALFVDDDTTARGLIRQNVEALGLTGKTRIFRRDATRLLASNKYAFPTAPVKCRMDVIRKLKVPKLEFYSTVRTAQDRKRFAKLATAVLAGIENKVFIPQPSWMCGDCSFSEACRAW